MSKQEAKQSSPSIFFDTCDTYHYHAAKKPIWRDGRLYATDGRILVWREMGLEAFFGAGRIDTECRISFRGVIELANIGICKAAHEIPAGIQETKPCGHDGLPEEFLEEFPNECPDCEGKGRARNLDKVQIRRLPNPVFFASHYLAFLKRHGVHEIRLPPGTVDPTMQPGYFQGPGFEGLLMPMLIEAPPFR